METGAFEPLYGPASGTGQSGFLPSVTVTATNASATASTQLPGNTGQRQVQIANTTTSWAYVNFGAFGNVAAATVALSYPIAPGSVIVLTLGADANGASVILGAVPGTNTAVIFTRGIGL